jgi:hypothetical protein
MKETTYKRLKRENQELRQKLLLLAKSPDSPDAIAVRQETLLQENIEAAVWAGENVRKIFNGINGLFK